MFLTFLEWRKDPLRIDVKAAHVFSGRAQKREHEQGIFTLKEELSAKSSPLWVQALSSLIRRVSCFDVEASTTSLLKAVSTNSPEL